MEDRVKRTAEDTEKHKPEPDVFLEAARRLGVRPQRCLVWEDSPLGFAAAGAAVAFGALPPKLNPFIQPLMGSVRRETDAPLQARAARSLASLIKLCVGRAPSPVHKIAGNVVATWLISKPGIHTDSIDANLIRILSRVVTILILFFLLLNAT